MGFAKMAVGAFVVFSLGGAYTYVAAQSGDPDLPKKALNFGFQQTADVMGEAAHVPANVVEEVKPGLKDLAAQGGGFLGGAADATQGWDDPTAADPTTTAPQP